MIDPGVQAPTGDPGAVSAAASWHDGLADYLETTASTISYTVGSLAGTNWDGEAARSYAELGVLVGQHFRQAGVTARTAAQTLHRYAGELEQFQRQGVQAVDQVRHWMDQLTKDEARLVRAQQAVSAAQAALDTATTTLNHAAVGTVPGVAVAAASLAYGQAQSALTKAQDDRRAAQRAVEDDTHQIEHWQQRARQIWLEAQNAAAVATSSLTPLEVTPPPLAGAPATFTDVLAADSSFLRAHPELAQPLAEQIAQNNAQRQHLDGGAVGHDEQMILAALDSGQNLSGVKLSVHHSGGGFLSGLLAAGAVVGTEILGGGPEDPAADAASAAEVAAIEGGSAAADALTAGEEADGLSLELKYKDGWSSQQIAEADAKVLRLNEAAARGDLRVVQNVERGNTSASRTYTAAGGRVPPGYDVDHVIDLQLGGQDGLDNMLPLNSSVNRSLGAQIRHAISGAEHGTPVTGVRIGPR